METPVHMPPPPDRMYRTAKDKLGPDAPEAGLLRLVFLIEYALQERRLQVDGAGTRCLSLYV